MITGLSLSSAVSANLKMNQMSSVLADLVKENANLQKDRSILLNVVDHISVHQADI